MKRSEVMSDDSVSDEYDVSAVKDLLEQHYRIDNFNPIDVELRYRLKVG